MYVLSEIVSFMRDIYSGNSVEMIYHTDRFTRCKEINGLLLHCPIYIYYIFGERFDINVISIWSNDLINKENFERTVHF